jgi:hypothetical protein
LRQKAIFAALMVLTMAVVDTRFLAERSARTNLKIELDQVITAPEALMAHLSERLGTTVMNVRVREIDYVRETMRLDVEATRL